MPATRTLALFCRVVDNFGDIGICWRLSRQLQQEHGVAVTLWVDDLASFQRICPQVDAAAELQIVDNVTVRHWRDQDGVFGVGDVADIVIEFFAVDIPPGYVEAMAQRMPRPVWLNLEGLSAEDWVEGCHSLPSTHPRLPLVKHFFFPGFTAKTGGLYRETGLAAQRDAFQADPATPAAFLAQYGVKPTEVAAFKVSLFCYPFAPVADLFANWAGGAEPVTCLVPEGVAVDAVSAFMASASPVGSEGKADASAAHAVTAGAAASRGNLTVRVLPFVAQPDYDKLLWSCDLNFVRGEDSFVRAQWAGRPFIWHIYEQDDALHHKKLRAFLQRYADTPDLASLADLSLAWNGALPVDFMSQWPAFRSAFPTMKARAGQWEAQMHDNGDLASNLLAFSGIMLGS
jgi:uncharacterized repeat protein (TIGR03837 family)